MRVLLVEDEQHKSDDIANTVLTGHKIRKVVSVRDAVVAVEEDDYDLIILDMALPTFGKAPKSSGGTAQTEGGVEVLRALKRARSHATVVIVSQYPDLEVDGGYLSLASAAIKLELKYKIRIVGSVLYDYQKKDWVEPLRGMIQDASSNYRR